MAFRGTASASQISTNADVRLKRIVTPSAPDEPPPPPVLRSESSLEDDDEPAGNGRLGLDLLVRTAAVAVDVTARGGDLLQDFARGLLNASGAVDVAPGLASTVEPCVHNGFWTAYAGVRPQLERALSEALATNEVRRVSFTGHSLGGALAQLASADFASGALCPTTAGADCVTFGAPRVGNAVWARAFSKLVPEAWRVVCDGDVIAFLRGCGYVHAGVEVVVDASAQTPGYVVVDPTPVEKKLRLGCGKSVGAHKLAAYRKGLWARRGVGEILQRDGLGTLSRRRRHPAHLNIPTTCCWIRRVGLDVDATPLMNEYNLCLCFSILVPDMNIYTHCALWRDRAWRPLVLSIDFLSPRMWFPTRRRGGCGPCRRGRRRLARRASDPSIVAARARRPRRPSRRVQPGRRAAPIIPASATAACASADPSPPRFRLMSSTVRPAGRLG